jgi:hypothetical protein
MERNLFGSRRLLAVLAAALSMSVGRGCIDTGQIRRPAAGGAGAGGSGGETGGGRAGQGGGGQSCDESAACGSGYCVDHVCCTTACTGSCVSCAVPGHVGTCWPLPRGSVDPDVSCLSPGPCGLVGTCDGRGACSFVPDDVPCSAPSCATDTLLDTAGTCDGLGACRPSRLTSCYPYRCVAGGCASTCAEIDDCAPGVACVDGSCGPKPLGVACRADGECASDHCADRVCCESACGSCRRCDQPTSLGSCVPVAAGQPDPLGGCLEQGPASCGRDGLCDGQGGCETYPRGTVCAEETCTKEVYTPPATCGGPNLCVHPEPLPCAPYTCEGARCAGSCTTGAQCAPGMACVSHSCGPKKVAASCGTAAECASGVCAQGVCCSTTCAGRCQSCALDGTRGTCAAVPAGAADPTGQCPDQGQSLSCGSNGRCDGNGGCQNQSEGTSSGPTSCLDGPAIFIPAPRCDGAGTVSALVPVSCAPFQCSPAGCKSSCRSNDDCLAPAICAKGSCGLKGNGQTCAAPTDCKSGFCEQSVCCAGACQAECRSCALPSSLGICSNVSNGSLDPQQICQVTAVSGCGTDGRCNGDGACRNYPPETVCAPPSCVAGTSMFMPAARCVGGLCWPASPIECAPYACVDGSCRADCASDADCVSPTSCSDGRCGDKKRLGQSCTTSGDCQPGNSCVDGGCCDTPSCPVCQACNVAGSAGHCTDLPAGTREPHGLCPPQPPCGNTGNCDGRQKCEFAGSNVSCGATACSGATLTLLSHCTGFSSCAPSNTVPCPAGFVCDSTTTCKTECNQTSDCAPPFTCRMKRCELAPNGSPCAAAAACASGFCTDGVCCSTGACDACQRCDVTGTGSCAPIPDFACLPA